MTDFSNFDPVELLAEFGELAYKESQIATYEEIADNIPDGIGNRGNILRDYLIRKAKALREGK